MQNHILTSVLGACYCCSCLKVTGSNILKSKTAHHEVRWQTATHAIITDLQSTKHFFKVDVSHLRGHNTILLQLSFFFFIFGKFNFGEPTFTGMKTKKQNKKSVFLEDLGNTCDFDNIPLNIFGANVSIHEDYYYCSL